MKKNYLTLIILILFAKANAQNTSVENSIFGIESGLFGIWAFNEAKLSNQITLRSELGLSGWYYADENDDIEGFGLLPTITLEPRWYYNLEKRQKKSKRIDGNSGNFTSIKTSYYPDWFAVTNLDNIYLVNIVSVIPTWGIRRSLGNHFTYEVCLGLGYVHYFYNDKSLVLKNESRLTDYFHLRLGYRF